MRILRLLASITSACALVATLLVASAPGAAAAVRQGDDPCTVFDSLRADAEELDSDSDFEAAAYTQIGKAFRKAGKDAPKELKAAMRKIGKFYKVVSKSDNTAEAVAAYADGLEKYAEAFATFGSYLAESCGGTASGSDRGSGNGTTLTLGDETITLSSGRCYLREQEAAGQKILFTGQASGTTADGEPIVLDVSRYDESSRFAGDDVSVDIGNPTSSDLVSWNGRFDTGTIERSGSTLEASGIELRNLDDGTTTTASFRISC